MEKTLRNGWSKSVLSLQIDNKFFEWQGKAIVDKWMEAIVDKYYTAGGVDKIKSQMNEWREYILEEVTEPSKNLYNPNGSDEFVYIGLDHIEQESLRLNGVVPLMLQAPQDLVEMGKQKSIVYNKFLEDKSMKKQIGKITFRKFKYLAGLIFEVKKREQIR